MSSRLAATGILITAFLCGSAAADDGATRLDFERRVQTQEAIERVYHAHRQGGSRTFAESLKPGLLEGKVRDYLLRSAALDRFWHRPITASALERELRRIERDTLYPGRLEELYAALGHDAFLIQECVARPALAGRLSRGYFAGDERIHGEARPRVVEAEEWWRRVEQELDLEAVRPVADPAVVLAAPTKDSRDTDPDCVLDDSWNNGALGEVPVGRHDHTAVWTGSEMILWGGYATDGTGGTMQSDSGARYDPLLNVFTPISRTGAPAPRAGHTAVWTGTEMIVWSGQSGGRYDPATDSWSPMSTTAAPASRILHTAVWTGAEMIVWGGRNNSYDPVNSGGRYDPATDNWSSTTTTDAPEPRQNHVAVWTGNTMIVWGGKNDTGRLNTGGRYDPATDSWESASTVSAPEGREDTTAVWTGGEVIVWGGHTDIFPYPNTGGRYDPGTDTWAPTALTGAPEARFGHGAVWTGGEMIVWGGGGDSDTAVGWRYDPVGDTWSSTSTVNAPLRRSGPTAVWTGDEMIVWGGLTTRSTGGRYDPVSDSWAPTGPSGTPQARIDHGAVWTGAEMIVWGGSVGSRVNGGARYDPLLDQWMPTSAANAPEERRGHTVVWTGDEMVVWGGTTSAATRSGGRYDPLGDAWQETTLAGAPSARAGHVAVWSGDEMIVWGGTPAGAVYYPYCEGHEQVSGGRYDPQFDSWTPISQSGAPRKDLATAVWTGDEMIMWGGGRWITNELFELCEFRAEGTGARYDPLSGTWSPTSTVDAPSGREGHTAVWAEDRMIVWGAAPPSNTGGVYLPGTDSWYATSPTGAPEPREGHSAVWTGDSMLVWGGDNDTVRALGDGSRYYPFPDVWEAVSLSEAPGSRYDHTAVWSGDFMIVWGGRYGSSFYLASGGRYAVNDNTDQDSDGMTDACDPCPLDAANDTDGDGTCEIDDNCPGLANPGQADLDSDALGDACDNCPATVNPGQDDADLDGLGDLCDGCPLDPENDLDADGICGDADNCAIAFNPAQADPDSDGLGSYCDLCPQLSDPLQADADADGAGDACDCSPSDPSTRPPALVGPLAGERIGTATARFAWPAAPGADLYSILRGNLSGLEPNLYGGCLSEGAVGTSFDDTALPASGNGFFYLVQGQSIECGLGTIGYDSSESARLNLDPQICQGVVPVDRHPFSEQAVAGEVVGAIGDVALSDDLLLSITEEESTGNPSGRYSYLEHRWSIDVAAGSRVELHVEGLRTDSPDGDDFAFEYSTDGGASWIPVALASLPTTDEDYAESATLPAGLAGTTLIRVIDTDRTPGHRNLDTVAIDELFIRSLP